MEDKYFVIAIGGTGMRCLEAFIHTCAMGMYDGKEITILALDTDLENGNFARVKNLIDAYKRIKGPDEKSHVSLKDTLFSAKIRFYKYSPDYSDFNKNGKFTSLFDYNKQKDRDIANLLLSKNVREFDLRHGYRAQTHLGSLLMYHSILSDIRKNQKCDLAKFITEILDASNNGMPKVFVLGSVFGGTGASSIPVIPNAFNAALQIIDPSKKLDKVLFGATLLTSYFTFPVPDEAQRKNEKVIASHNNFSINSQAAMMFYENDNTVKTTYKSFYVLGTESLNFKTEQPGNKTLTGGLEQKNDSHFIELMAAFAAFDFFKTPVTSLTEHHTAKYYCRSIDDSGKLEFTDFVGANEEFNFASRFAALVVSSFLANHPKAELFSQAQLGKIENYNTSVDLPRVTALKEYMSMFHYKIDQNNNIEDGWLRQVHRSAGGSDKFLFHPELFSISTFKQLDKFDWGKYLYCKDNNYADCNFSSGFSSPYAKFKSEFLKENDSYEIVDPMEKLIKRSFDTTLNIYKFSKKTS